MEKMFGTWYREYRPIYTPLEAGMDRYLKLDHEFVGRAALEAGMERGPERRMVYLEVDPDPDEPADVIGDEPIWHDGEVVGWVTSGAYAHYSGVSLALGYIPAALATSDTAAGGLEIEIIGHRRPARMLREPVLDPSGSRMRA
jgi:dimethylglycine dehydrogenase